MKDLQNLLFSPILDTQHIKSKINELKDHFSKNEINHQIILAFSLNYEKIPILLPFLFEPKIEEKEFIHDDQELLFHLLKNNISFPLSIIANIAQFNKLERFLYDELKKHNKLDTLRKLIKENNNDIVFKGKNFNEKKKEEGKLYNIREKTKLEDIIERDDIDSFRLISMENNFDFNGIIQKENKLFKYAQIPIILYCIEKNAQKCFKYGLINGADPSQKSNILRDFLKTKKEVWDGYGFAGAIGNIQTIKMIEDQGIRINENVMKGASKFHQNQIIKWIEKEHKSLLKAGIKECIKFENYEAFSIINENCDVISIYIKNKTLLHYAAEKNSKKIGELLISKGADINAKILFLKKII